MSNWIYSRSSFRETLLHLEPWRVVPLSRIPTEAQHNDALLFILEKSQRHSVFVRLYSIELTTAFIVMRSLGLIGDTFRFFFSISPHSRSEIKRASGKKSQFLQGFWDTGLESRMGTFRCFVFPVFLSFKTIWNHTDGGTRMKRKSIALTTKCGCVFENFLL